MAKKVTVVGAGFYGSTTALRLAEYDIFETVVLTDVIEGKPEGLALDLNQSRWIEGFETLVVGQTTGPNGEGYEAKHTARATLRKLLASGVRALLPNVDRFLPVHNLKSLIDLARVMREPAERLARRKH